MTDIEQEARAIAEQINEKADRDFSNGVENAMGVDEWSFVQGASWAASRPTPPATGEQFYCPIHGDLLAGNRSMRCAEAAPGHEFARPAPATREAVARALLDTPAVDFPGVHFSSQVPDDVRDAEALADALLAAFTITEKGAES